jgi:dynein heavy chain
MRAVKSVLVMAGSLKRANPDLDEDAVLIRAFKDSNLPKFLADDVELFLALLSDLFPGVNIPAQDYGELQSAIETCIEEAGLQRVPNFVTKVIQLYETMNVRFGVMAVGPTGGGKTTCYRMLQAAMTKLRAAGHANLNFQATQAYVLNPKCIKMGELYGEYNLLTNEWRDGLASTIIRQCVADTTQDRKWVVFDGPVDAIWIENMNTVSRFREMYPRFKIRN